MAKYIIDIPEKEMMYINTWEYKNGKCVWTNSYTTSNLRPYTASESYIDGLKKGQEEVWGFVKKMEHEIPVCDLMDIYGDESEIYQNFTYQEAKTKYDTWKRKKEEIHVGDEVKITEGGSLCVVCGIINGTANLIFEDGGLGQFLVDKLIKTGRHLDGVEKLLKEMREEN